MCRLAGLELFGDSYSGLEYDYRGLCNVYNVLDDENKFFQFHAMLEDWRQRRAHRPDPHVSGYAVIVRIVVSFHVLFIRIVRPHFWTCATTAHWRR